MREKDAINQFISCRWVKFRYLNYFRYISFWFWFQNWFKFAQLFLYVEIRYFWRAFFSLTRNWSLLFRTIIPPRKQLIDAPTNSKEHRIEITINMENQFPFERITSCDWWYAFIQSNIRCMQNRLKCKM